MTMSEAQTRPSPPPPAAKPCTAVTTGTRSWISAAVASCSHAVASRRYCRKLGALGFEGADIAARTEVAAGATEQHHPNRRVCVAAQDRFVQRLQQFDVEPVGCVGAVQAQLRDPVVADVERHRCSVDGGHERSYPAELVDSSPGDVPHDRGDFVVEPARERLPAGVADQSLDRRHRRGDRVRRVATRNPRRPRRSPAAQSCGRPGRVARHRAR